MATFLLEDEGIPSLGCAVFKKDAEFVDQIYDRYTTLFSR
jgi:hypothetical protein